MGLIHEIGHLVIARHRQDHRPDALAVALRTLETRLGRTDTQRLLDGFATEFPGRTARPEPRPARLEELILIRVANENPAIGPLRELVDDRRLERQTRYRDAIAGLEVAFGDGPRFGPDGRSLIELLRAPARHSPTSLAGQLRYIREHWGAILGDALAALIARMDLAIGVIAEEEASLHLRFGGGGPPRGEPPKLGGADEPEAFSSDSAWMPRVVLIAKSSYVWLDQLSREYGRDIRTLDAIPDEELDTLARWGVTGLWLIGLWERSEASERIKRMRGNVDAVASAYSLDDYRIAGDLGGEPAYAQLRDRAWARGIRLASDMVPNHMGIDFELGDRASGMVPLARAAPVSGLHLRRPGPLVGRAGRHRARRPLLGRHGRGRRLQALRSAIRRDALRLSRQRRDELPLERHGPARLPRCRGPRAGHRDDPRGRAALPDHPLRRGDGPRQEAHRAPVVAGARQAGRHPVACRARDVQTRIRQAHAGRVLA